MVTRRDVVRGLAAAGAWTLAGSPSSARARPSQTVRARVLGTVQDGGLPHPGCSRSCCVGARRGAGSARRVSCLGLGILPDGPLVVVDATPDYPSQAAELGSAFTLGADPVRPSRVAPDFILLTHAHVGHYAGLIYLGREASAARDVPVIATPRMCAFLESNKPWSRLVEWGHLRLEPLEPGGRRRLAAGLEVETFAVPHRDEDSDTVGFLFRGPTKRLIYIPDTDSWKRWERPVDRLLEGADIALLDGTFYGSGEVTWRNPEEIPHPTIRETMELLGSLAASGKCRILFTHLNHSNAALDPSSEASREVVRRGFEVAVEGLELAL